MVPRAGIEPARCFHRGIFLPTTAFAAAFQHLWSGLSLHHIYKNVNIGGCRQVSTRSRLNQGFARDCHQHYLEGFPEFDTIHTRSFLSGCSSLFKSLASTNFATWAGEHESVYLISDSQLIQYISVILLI